MSVAAPLMPCYLVEWYRPELRTRPLEEVAAKLEECAAMLSANGSPVQLVMTLAVPAEEVLFGIFQADSADSVSEACTCAGMPGGRLSEALNARITSRS